MMTALTDAQTPVASGTAADLILVTYNHDYSESARVFPSILDAWKDLATSFGFTLTERDGIWVAYDDMGIYASGHDADGTVIWHEDDDPENEIVGCKLGSSAFFRWLSAAYDDGKWRGCAIYRFNPKTMDLTRVEPM